MKKMSKKEMLQEIRSAFENEKKLSLSWFGYFFDEVTLNGWITESGSVNFDLKEVSSTLNYRVWQDHLNRSKALSDVYKSITGEALI